MNERTRGPAFDAVLRSTLRSGKQMPSSGCPEPDLLAAYFEHSLIPSETTQLESHVSTCSRCREILAALTVEELKPAENVLTAARTGPLAAAPPATFDRVHADALPRTEAVSRPRLFLNWRWLAPTAVAAAAFALWVALRPAPGTHQAQLSSDQAASVPAPHAREALPTRDEQLPKPESESNARKGPDSLVASSAPRSAISTRGGRVKKDDVVRFSRENAQASDPAKTGSDPRTFRPQLSDVPSRIFVERSRVEQDQLARERDPSPQAPPTPFAHEKQEEAAKYKEEAKTAGAAVSEKPRLDEASRDSKKRAPETPRLPAPDVTSVGTYRAKELETSQPSLALALQPNRQVPAPGSSTLWRFGSAGLIERSLDAGQSWQRQESHVTVELLAASAPTENVCWIVGRAGTILRTADGVTWERIPSPEPADWIAVVARSAQVAIIASRESRRYTTADAGRTWQRQ